VAVGPGEEGGMGFWVDGENVLPLLPARKEAGVEGGLADVDPSEAEGSVPSASLPSAFRMGSRPGRAACGIEVMFAEHQRSGRILVYEVGYLFSAIYGWPATGLRLFGKFRVICDHLRSIQNQIDLIIVSLDERRFYRDGRKIFPAPAPR
jgi:hypothetical protein